MSNKIVPIKYTSRDYESIRRDLIEHAKRYYPNSFKDFNEASFGSLMIDTVSYIGDILSFYLDYQANECFLDTASEFNNVIKIAKQMGYKFNNVGSSTGLATFYISVPANAISLGPNRDYAPILKKGSTFSTRDGTKFILNEDVRFDSPTLEYTSLNIASDSSPNTYAIKAYGTVISGVITSERITVGEYEKFLKVKLAENNIIEILSVFDEDGNEYYEVNNLSQNIVYKSFSNTDSSTSNLAKEIIKPHLAVRRFTVENELGSMYLQFGASSDVTLPDNKSMITEPSRVVLNTFGKEYISDDSFDPSRLLNSDKFGIAPSNTILTVTYRYQPVDKNINYAVDSIVNVDDPQFYFFNEQNLVSSEVSNTIQSLDVGNDAPIVGDISVFDSNELKIRIKNAFSTQNRAVTLEDYKAMCYAMPTKFGSIKRINAIRDDNSLKRNINLYVLCEDEQGYLSRANQVVKSNLKTWLLKSKMLNDSIDILDGKIVNYGIKFVVKGYNNKPKYDILSDAISQIANDFSMLPDFGESFIISNVLKSLKKVEGVLDVISIKLEPKIGSNGNLTYSDYYFDLEQNMSNDKTYIKVPRNVIMELKYPNSDIQGTIL